MNNLEYLNIIDKFEDKTLHNIGDYYYHGFLYNQNSFIDMLIDGIKCPKLIDETSYNGSNGKYYICLSKNINVKKSSFNLFSSFRPMFILDNITPLKTHKYGFTKSILPIREGIYDDEYQSFYKINSNKIIGIQYKIYEMLSNDSKVKKMFNMNDEDCIKYLYNLKEMIEILNKLSIDIPIYDFSAMKEINKEKVLTLL